MSSISTIRTHNEEHRNVLFVDYNSFYGCLEKRLIWSAPQVLGNNPAFGVLNNSRSFSYGVSISRLSQESRCSLVSCVNKRLRSWRFHSLGNPFPSALVEVMFTLCYSTTTKPRFGFVLLVNDSLESLLTVSLSVWGLFLSLGPDIGILLIKAGVVDSFSKPYSGDSSQMHII